MAALDRATGANRYVLTLHLISHQDTLADKHFTGLFGFAWTTLGPQVVHWIVPMIFAAMVGIANYTIYFSSVDYMVASYGVYSASACGGNAWARDFFAGISAMYASPLYHNLGKSPKPAVNYASTLLASVSCLVVLPIYVFYWYGPQIRDRSKFAKTLAADREKTGGRRVSKADNLEPSRSQQGVSHMP